MQAYTSHISIKMWFISSIQTERFRYCSQSCSFCWL